MGNRRGAEKSGARAGAPIPSAPLRFNNTFFPAAGKKAGKRKIQGGGIAPLFVIARLLSGRSNFLLCMRRKIELSVREVSFPGAGKKAGNGKDRGAAIAPARKKQERKLGRPDKSRAMTN
jgi:hypothetical protein